MEFLALCRRQTMQVWVSQGVSYSLGMTVLRYVPRIGSLEL